MPKRKRASEMDPVFLSEAVPAIIQHAYVDCDFFVVLGVYEEIKQTVKIAFIHQPHLVVGKNCEEICHWFHKLLAGIDVECVDEIFYYRNQINLHTPYVIQSLKEGLKQMKDLHHYFDMVYSEKFIRLLDIQHETIKNSQSNFDELLLWLNDQLPVLEMVEYEQTFVQVH